MKPLSPTLPIALLSGVLLAGCATTPLPDGSRIQRLPESTAAAPVLDEQQTRALTELNARILAEQNQARQREEALAARPWRDPPPIYWGMHYSRGWGHAWDGWAWTGSRWAWRPRWGVDVWVPFGY